MLSSNDGLQILKKLATTKLIALPQSWQDGGLR